MNIFIYESICASGIASPLRQEGRAMLSAIAKDFLAIPGCAVSNLMHDEEKLFRSLAARADSTLVIAPETGGVLAERSQWVLEENGRLLGCYPDAIALTGDKKRLAAYWQERGVPTPALIDAANFPGYPVVRKPRDGAGSQDTLLIRDEDTWRQAHGRPSVGLIVQRFVPGQPASVAFLIGPNSTVPLIPAAQHLSDDGRFHYLGGHLPLDAPLAARAVELGRRAIAGISGLHGYVGVDLVLGNNAQEDFAIEINPRLTTSYLGLRRLARGNLAQLWSDVVGGGSVEPPSWLPGPVSFTADGALGEC